MTTSVYHLHKGINKPIVFRGLRAQYILYAAGVLVGSLLFFTILFIGGVSPWICLPLTITLAAAGILAIYRLSHRYGEYGLLKRRAARRLPTALRSHSRYPFIDLKNTA
ncbi:MAG TPA: DUF4133 domain-containing protein [Puia sp.]|nr:DUF4133 domain-containing protein [Puia sp.]